MGTGGVRRVALMLLTLLLLGFWAWWASRSEPLEVAVAAAAPGRVDETVVNTRAGTVKACRRARLSPSAGGQIATLPVREGDHVERGQLLLELWNQDLLAQLTLAQQEAASAAASARARCIEAEQAQREANRLEQLLGRRLVSEEQVDQAISAADSSAAGCEAARATEAVNRAHIGLAEANLQKTRLLAPFEGVVAQINGELNEYVTPSPIGIPTPPAIDLIDNRCFYLTAPIDEVDVAGIAIGQTARITLDAFGDEAFAGKVRRIADYVLDLEKQARTVDVEVEFVNRVDLQRLLAGYSADVEIILQSHPQTLRIPTEAVFDGDQVYVLLPADGVIQRREVQIGLANWDHSEILGGLEAGELVVTSVDRQGLEDGVAARRETDSGE